METHLSFSDEEFESQFASCKLLPTLFSHEAHIRLAWIHLQKYGEEKAIQNICQQIKAFAANAGAPGKFHQTVTVAAVKAVKHFMGRSQADNFSDFIAEFPRLRDNFRELIEAHYGFDVFNSKKAREEFLDPDLLPFD